MAHQIKAEIALSRELDPMLQAVADFIAAAEVLPSGADLSDFTPANVVVIPPEAEIKAIDAAVTAAVSKAKGLCLLILGGSANNPDPDSPGPRMVVSMELQLYVLPKRRQPGSRTPLELVVALLKGLHDAQIRPTGFPWFEEIRAMGYDPLPDDDLVAYSLEFEREMQF
jgi:hypothetical protein